MKKRIALLAVTLSALLLSTGCGKEKSNYRSLSSEGAIKKINKDNKK
jgi:ABC-type phosphate/phosphonate transport system substrate-binding protein